MTGERPRIGNTVLILPLELFGAVVSIESTVHGIQYYVRYFKDKEPYEQKFFPNELKKAEYGKNYKLGFNNGK